MVLLIATLYKTAVYCYIATHYRQSCAGGYKVVPPGGAGGTVFLLVFSSGRLHFVERQAALPVKLAVYFNLPDAC